METLKVSSKSNPNAVAGALAGTLRSQGRVEVQTVGAGALNQAIKAMAIARSFLGEGGLDLACVPSFADIEIDGEARTAIRLLVEQRSIDRTPVSVAASVAAPTVLIADGAGSAPPAPTADTGRIDLRG